MQPTWIRVGDLRRHLKAHAEEGSNKFNQCDFTFIQAGNYLKIHFDCDWCDKYMVSDSALREHIECHIQERSPFITLEL